MLVALAVAWTALTVLPGVARAEIGFATSSITGFQRPAAVAIDDFSGDDMADLVVADYARGGVHVLLGDGHGTFAVPQFYPTGIGAISVVTGDLNHDDHPDLVVANNDAGTISVLLGQSGGTFGSATNVDGLGTYIQDVTLADLDRDGELDIALITNDFPIARVVVLFGRGNGSFGAPIIRSYSGQSPVNLVAGDLTQDGQVDLAITEGNGTTITNLIVMPGNGDGTFDGDLIFNTGGSPYGEGGNPGPRGLTLDDFDRDGDPDVAVVNSQANDVAVLLNSGNGSLLPAVPYVLGPDAAGAPWGVESADLDADGNADLVVSGAPGAYGLFVLRGNGDGTFESRQGIVIGSNNRGLAIGDLDRDGHLDVAVADFRVGGAVHILRQVVADTTPPAVSCGEADGAWHAENVLLTCTASDPDSGLAASADVSFTLTTDVAVGQERADASTGVHQVCDREGNCVTAGPIVGNKVDRKAPAIILTAPAGGSRYSVIRTRPRRARVAVSYACGDNGSGVASCAGTQPSGTMLDTGFTALGRRTFVVTATDAAGNASSVRHTYRVVLLW